MKTINEIVDLAGTVSNKLKYLCEEFAVDMKDPVEIADAKQMGQIVLTLSEDIKELTSSRDSFRGRTGLMNHNMFMMLGAMTYISKLEAQEGQILDNDQKEHVANMLRSVRKDFGKFLGVLKVELEKESVALTEEEEQMFEEGYEHFLKEESKEQFASEVVTEDEEKDLLISADIEEETKYAD